MTYIEEAPDIVFKIPSQMVSFEFSSDPHTLIDWVGQLLLFCTSRETFVRIELNDNEMTLCVCNVHVYNESDDVVPRGLRL
jgi:hypothetical protein